MKNERIIAAYNRKKPDAYTQNKILRSILRHNAASAEKEDQSAMKQKHILRTVVITVISLSALAALAVGGNAAYKAWSLPEPTTYEPADDGSIYEVTSSTKYTSEILEEPSSESEAAPSSEPQTPTDQEMITSAVKILEIVGLSDVSTDSMKVSRQTDLSYGREEVAVTFTQSEVHTDFTFLASTGKLLHMSSIDFVGVTGVDPAKELSAEQMARYYYSILPVEQGYDLIDHVEYDDEYYSYDFCRKVSDDLYNAYEMVRIGINPQTGRLCGVNVFCFPLLDDHQEGDVALTKEDALAVLAASDKTARLVSADTCYELQSAEIRIVLPNWVFSEQDDGNINRQYSEITRYAWSLTFENPTSEFADEVYVYVDLYTGEILGGDMT